MRCLIADDRPDADALWRSALGWTGWTGALAVTAAEAQIALFNARFDLVIIDMMLERGRGPVVVDLAAEQGTPVILMADDLTLCSGLPLALAPAIATVAPRALTLAEAEAMLRNHASAAPAARFRTIRTPTVATPAPVAQKPETVASSACPSGPESGKVSRRLPPASRSAPFSNG